MKLKSAIIWLGLSQAFTPIFVLLSVNPESGLITAPMLLAAGLSLQALAGWIGLALVAAAKD